MCKFHLGQKVVALFTGDPKEGQQPCVKDEVYTVRKITQLVCCGKFVITVIPSDVGGRSVIFCKCGGFTSDPSGNWVTIEDLFAPVISVDDLIAEALQKEEMDVIVREEVGGVLV